MSSSGFAAPAPIHRFFALFPLHTYPAIENPYSRRISRPCLWIHPPREPSSSQLSSDVECLKWQAYLALRGITDLELRWDIAPEAGVDGHLPTLQLPTGRLLGTTKIPAWADALQESTIDPLEGYKDAPTRDESRAWVVLLEGTVHAELEVAALQAWTWTSLLYQSPRRALESIVYPPPAPLSGITSPFPPSGVQVPTTAIHLRYKEAIESISERLGDDEWFLGSSSPTALDALLFAYLHCALDSLPLVKREVERRENLVAWERRVRSLVSAPAKS